MPEDEPEPVEPAPEPEPQWTEEEQHAVAKGWRLPSWLRRWGALIGKVASVVGLIGAIWKGAIYLDDLHDTIKHNAEQVRKMDDSNLREHRRLREHMNKMVSATRKARDKDQKVVTQLRIAIAAMQAADRVRHGEASYVGLSDTGSANVSDSDPLAEVHIDPEPPRTYREREEQVSKANKDAEEAMQKAIKIQLESSSDDPLGALKEEL